VNAHTLSRDAARLRAVRENLASIAPARWQRVHDETGAFIETRGAMGELFVLARFDPLAAVEEIDFACDAPDVVAFLLRLLDAAFAEVRRLKDVPTEPPRNTGKDYAAECAMKCAEPAFRAFLGECHGLERPWTDVRVAQRVRGLLGVTSRAELNHGGDAVERWKSLRDAFAAWRRAAR